MVEDSLIDDYTVTNATWAAKLSKSGFGDPGFDTPENILVKVQYAERFIKSPRDGERKISTTQIFFNPSYDINVGDRITIAGTNYEVELLDIHSMFETEDHKEAVLIILVT